MMTALIKQSGWSTVNHRTQEEILQYGCIYLRYSSKLTRHGYLGSTLLVCRVVARPHLELEILINDLKMLPMTFNFLRRITYKYCKLLFHMFKHKYCWFLRV